MPCWQRQTTKLDMKNADKGVMADALRELGFDVQETAHGVYATKHGRTAVECYDGNVTIYDDAVTQTQVRQQYARSAIAKVSRRYGWTQQKQGEKVVLTRRTR
jgi:Tfp pilus assembly pilus retraction ATPase PilT